MALFKCKECGNEISDQAKFCPQCGCPTKISLEPVYTEILITRKNKYLIYFLNHYGIYLDDSFICTMKKEETIRCKVYSGKHHLKIIDTKNTDRVFYDEDIFVDSEGLSITYSFDSNGNFKIYSPNSPYFESIENLNKDNIVIKKMVKISLKIIIFLAVIYLILSAISFILSDNNENIPADSGISKETIDNNYAITKTILYDKDNIKITVNSLDYNSTWNTYGLNLEIINGSTDTISYKINYVKINGFTISAYAFSEIYSNCTDNFYLSVLESDLKMAGINQINSVEFDIKIIQQDTNDNFNVPVIINTLSNNRSEEEFHFNGIEIYNDNGITVYYKTLNKSDLVQPIRFYIINNTEKNINVCYEDIAFNGEMIGETLLDGTILKKSQRVSNMRMLYFGNKPDIEKIDEIKMKLYFQPIEENGSIVFNNAIQSEEITIAL